MKNTGKLVMVALFVLVSIVAPFNASAATVEELNTQRITLIEQLIEVLQAKVLELTAILEAQSKPVITTSEPVFGSVIPTIVSTPALTVSTSFGKGSWDSRENNDRFRDGMVKFVINGDYKKATLTYHESGKVPTLAEQGKMDLSPDGIHGYFQPNTSYTYDIGITDMSDKESHVTGEFTTGSY